MDKDYLKLKVLFVIRYISDALFFTLFNLFLVSIGLTESKIGIISGVGPFLCLIIYPVLTFITKDANKAKLFASILTLFEGIAVIIVGNLHLFETIIIVGGMIYLCDNPFYSISDSYAVTLSDVVGKDFSVVRKFGSLGYILGTLLASLLVLFLDYYLIFLIAGLLMIMVSFIYQIIRPIDLSMINNKAQEKGSIKEVLKNPHFIVFALILSSIYSIARTYHTYVPIYFKTELGINDSLIALYDSLRTILEFLVMLFIVRFFKNKSKTFIFILLGTTYCITPLLVFFKLNFWCFSISSLVRAFAFTIYIYVYSRQTEEIVGIKNIPTALLIIGIFIIILKIIFQIVYGYLFEIVGYQIPSLITSICFLILGITYGIIVIKEPKFKE